jgi:hypothetical protein
MPECIMNANEALLSEIVHKHQVQRSASMSDIGQSLSRFSMQKPSKNIGKWQNKYQCGENLQLLS